MIRNPRSFSFTASPDTDVTAYHVSVRKVSDNSEVCQFNIAVGTDPGQVTPDGAGLCHVDTAGAGGPGLKAQIDAAGGQGVECNLFISAVSPEGTSSEVEGNATFDFSDVVDPPANVSIEA